MKKTIILLVFVFVSIHGAFSQQPDAKQTKAVFDLIFGQGAATDLDINDEDKQKANLLLKELIEKSCMMAGVEGTWKGAYSLNASIMGIASSIIQPTIISVSKV